MGVWAFHSIRRDSSQESFTTLGPLSIDPFLAICLILTFGIPYSSATCPPRIDVSGNCPLHASHPRKAATAAATGNVKCRLANAFGMKEGGVRVEGRWTVWWVGVGLFIALSLDQQTASGGELEVGERRGSLSSFSSSFHPPNKHVRVCLPLPLLPRGQLRESRKCICPGDAVPLAAEGFPLGVLSA